MKSSSLFSDASKQTQQEASKLFSAPYVPRESGIAHKENGVAGQASTGNWATPCPHDTAGESLQGAAQYYIQKHFMFVVFT